jgi:hypothetical protein
MATKLFLALGTTVVLVMFLGINLAQPGPYLAPGGAPATALPLPPGPPSIGTTFTPAAAGIAQILEAGVDAITTLHVIDICRFSTPLAPPFNLAPGTFTGTGGGGWIIDDPRFIQQGIGINQIQFRLCLNFDPGLGAGLLSNPSPFPWTLWIVMGANPFGLTPPIAMKLGAIDCCAPDPFFNTPAIPTPFSPATYGYSLILTSGATALPTVIDVVDPIIVTGVEPPAPTGRRPRCIPTGSGTDPDGKKFFQITVNADEGLLAITNNPIFDRQSNSLVQSNVNVSIPNFTPGITDPLVITATKIDKTKNAKVSLSIYDIKGNKLICGDPALTLAENLNSKLSFDPSKCIGCFTYHKTTGCHYGPGQKCGDVYPIIATFQNTSSVNLSDIFFTVKQLDGSSCPPPGCTLQNADGGPGGVGAQISVPAAALGPNGILPAGGTFTQAFYVKLTQHPEGFTFFVDAFGSDP